VALVAGFVEAPSPPPVPVSVPSADPASAGPLSPALELALAEAPLLDKVPTAGAESATVLRAPPESIAEGPPGGVAGLAASPPVAVPLVSLGAEQLARAVTATSAAVIAERTLVDRFIRTLKRQSQTTQL
jgi:hypothetical protein